MPVSLSRCCILSPHFALLAFAAAACSTPHFEVLAGYASTRLGGRLGLGDAGSATADQGVSTAFGLGDAVGSPYLRTQVVTGPLSLTGSVLRVQESGQGRLDTPFGGLGQGTAIGSEIDLWIVKLDAVHDFTVGPLQVSPGLLFDVYSLAFTARELAVGNAEVVDDVVAVPMPFVRLQADAGGVLATVEAGYLEAAIGDGEGRFLDLEGRLQWSPGSWATFFLGYRAIGIDGSGDTDAGSFSADLQLRGWTLGGGLRF